MIDPAAPIIERVRSIKHYDNYFRTPPPKRLKEGEVAPKPKQLCEAHFISINEISRSSITKFLIMQQELARNKKKKAK